MLSRLMKNAGTKGYRMAALVLIVIITLACAVVLNLGMFKYGQAKQANIKGAYLDLSDHDWLYSPPLRLSGEWEFFNRIIEPGYEGSGALVNIPETKLQAHHGPVSYRVKLHTDATFISIYYQYSTFDVKVYFDGVLINDQKTMGNFYSAMIGKYLFYAMGNENTTEHEMLITCENPAKEIPLYQTVPTIGDMVPIGNHTVWLWSREFLLMGVVIIAVLNGLYFMFIRPEHKNMSAQTIFDTFIGLRVLMATPISSMLLNALLGINFSMCSSIKMQTITLLLTAFSGNWMMASLFNDKDASRAIRLYSPLFIAEALAVLVLPVYTIDGMRYIFLATLLVNYAFLGVYMLRLHRAHNTVYYNLQIVKTLAIFVVIFTDMYSLTGFSPHKGNHFIYYCILLLLHLVIKLVDNNASYAHNEQLTNKLENLVEERTEQLMRANEKLAQLSTRDALTHAYNRLQFEQYTEGLLEHYRQKPFPVSMSILDIDFFKNINDRYGHDAGDEVLIEMVKVVNGCLNEHMHLFRIGGEEFVIMAEHMTEAEAMQPIECIRKTLMGHTFARGIRLTASFGLAEYKGGMNMKDLFRQVDKCLYLAKNAGRNRVIAYSAPRDKQLLSS